MVEAIGAGTLSGLTKAEAIALLEDGDHHIIYEYYRTTKDWSHNYMADFYRDTFARVTQEYDTGVAVPEGQQPLQKHKDIAWLGLMNFPDQTPTIVAFDQLPNSEKNRILTVLNNMLTDNVNQTCTE